MNFRTRILVVLSLSLACFIALGVDAQQTAPPKIRALIFSGRNNHDWASTTPFLKKMYEDSGRFTVDVTDDPSTCTGESLSNYDVIVDNWSAYPDMTGRQWGKTAEDAVLDFIRNGKGFVVAHAATACFADWPEFMEIAGCAWRDNAGHSAIHAFPVAIVDTQHPITQGMTDFMSAPDELYHRQTPHPAMKTLCSVYSDPAKGGTGNPEPGAVVIDYGKGRCFNNILGHDVTAMKGIGYQTLMLRGTEWAATGAVTIPIPANWPAAKRPIKAVVLTGGHAFDEAAFPPLFQGHDDIECTIVPQLDDSEIFEDITGWPYDVLVMYNMSQRISEKRRANFVQLLENGVGLVGLHHAIVAYKEWPEFEHIVGARYFLKETTEGNVTYPLSTYKHDIDFTLHIADPSHPITRGMRDFSVHDETYNDWILLPDTHLLMTSGHPDSGPGITWVKTYKNAKVCFIQPGHGPSVFSDPNYKHVVAQAIRWSAGRLEEDFAQLFKNALDDIAAYEQGQSCAGLYRAADLMRSALNNPAERAIVEEQLLAALQSNATLGAKDLICKQLSIVASEKSVPVLAALLPDEQMSTLARYALVRIQGPAPDEALRNALPNTSGNVKIGIINSLGDRRDEASVPVLAAVLSDSDVLAAASSSGALVKSGNPAAAAAAAALGKIGNPAAADALCAAAKDATAHEVVTRALLQCADRLSRQGDTQRATAIFEMIYNANKPEAIKMAAFRGLAVTRGEAAAPQVAAALAGDDAGLYSIALGLVRSLPGAASTQAFVDVLPKLPPDRKTPVIDALAGRADIAARPAVVAAASDADQSVRIAALNALAKLGDASIVPQLTNIASTASGEEKKAACEALARIHDPAVDVALLAGLKDATPPVRVAMIRAMADRQTANAAPVLLDSAKDADPAVREESLKALAVLGADAELAAVVDLMLAAQSDTERNAAEKALVEIARRMPPEPSPSALIAAKIPFNVPVPVACAAIRVVGAIADPTALAGLRAVLREDSRPEERDAAVRALADWPNVDALDALYAAAKNPYNETNRVLALRGYVRLLGLPSERPMAETIDRYRKALELARQPDERKQVLGGLANIADPQALDMVSAYFGDADVQTEAATAAFTIAGAIAAANPQAVEAAMSKLIGACKDEALLAQARGVLSQARLQALQAQNIATQGTASSPDNLDKDGGAGDDAAAIDGNPETYWDEVNNQPLYILQVDFAEPKEVAAISILGYNHQDYAPRDFEIVCDGKAAQTVQGAVYEDNLLVVEFPKQTCKTVQLTITGYYGDSPAIRELGIYSVPVATATAGK